MSHMQTQLVPRNRPVGLGPQYVGHGTTCFRITHHAGMTNESKMVKDPAGQTVFTCSIGSGLCQRKELRDASGNVLFTTATRVLAKSRETTGLFASGQPAFTVVKRDLGKGFMSKLTGGRTGVDASFHDPINGPVTLSIGAREYSKSEATVQDQAGAVLAFIKWDGFGSDSMSWSDNGKSGDGSGTDYDLAIASGVDVALMVALVACYDAMRVEKAIKMVGDILDAM